VNHQTLSSFIWSVANLLRGDYKQSEYGRVILPFTVLRRLDCVLEPTKAAVLAEHVEKTKAGLNPEPFLLRKAGQSFYNTSSMDMSKLVGAGLTGALYAAGRDDEAHNALIKWREVGVSEGGYRHLNDPPDREIMNVRLELALLRLGRWPYSLDPHPHQHLSKALFKFQADENLPQNGKPDEATLARLGITSQAGASTSK
jgi:hypothetical protein